jgi:hypothetical protein
MTIKIDNPQHSRQIAFGLLGSVSVGNDLANHRPVGKKSKLSRVIATAKVAPQGADLVIDLRKNGTGDAIATITIAEGLTTYDSNVINNGASFEIGDYLSIDCIQVGSITTGSDVSVVCVLR